MAKLKNELPRLPPDIMSKSPEEILEIAKRYTGVETGAVKSRYPVEYDPIRRYCHMTGDLNPLYLNPEYTRKTKYKGVVCPPLLIGNFAGPGAWPPVTGETPGGALPTIPTRAPGTGRKAVNMSTEWEFFKPVIVGDRLSTKTRIADVHMKPISRDPEAIWTVTERIITNQRNEVVAIWRNTSVGWRDQLNKK